MVKKTFVVRNTRRYSVPFRVPTLSHNPLGDLSANVMRLNTRRLVGSNANLIVNTHLSTTSVDSAQTRQGRVQSLRYKSLHLSIQLTNLRWMLSETVLSNCKTQCADTFSVFFKHVPKPRLLRRISQRSKSL